MRKQEILDILWGIPLDYINQEIIEKIAQSLLPDTEYEFTKRENAFSILSDVGANYAQKIEFEYDKESKNKSVVIISKEYERAYSRYPIFHEEGLEIYTDSCSYVYDSNGLLLHKSHFSDDHKHFGNAKMDFSKESMIKYFDATTPTYEKGYFKHGPESAFAPFTNIWQRYNKTNVVRIFGRNPMNGEYSDIAVTFNNGETNKDLLGESYDKIFYRSDSNLVPTTYSIPEIVEKIDKIYNESITDEGFDHNKFDQKFNSSILKTRGR